MSYVIEKDNCKKYYNDRDLLHREDGPAMIYVGYCCWYFNGQRHRLDGPTRIWTYTPEEEKFIVAFHRKNKPEWWYKDQWIPCSSQEEFERKIKLLHFL